MNIFERFWAWLTGEAKQLPTIETNIVNFADKVVNDIKTIASSNVASYIETGLTTVASVIDPALLPLIAGIENYIPKVIGLITGVTGDITAETGKSVAQQIEDGITALQGIKAIDGTVYAGLLATLQTSLQNYILTNNAVALGVAPTVGTQLAVGQVVHANNSVAA